MNGKIDGKKWYMSKMVLLGVIEIALAVLEVTEKGGTLTAAIIAGLGVATIALRGVTSQKLTR
jgi:L-serine deaminase